MIYVLLVLAAALVLIIAVVSVRGADGDVVYRKNFGGSGTDIYYSVAEIPGGFVAVGYSENSSFGNGDWSGVTGKGGYDAIIVKYDDNGDMVWAKNFGGSGHDCFNSVTPVPGGFVAVGYSGNGSFGNGDWSGVTGKGGNDAIIVKYDDNGDVLWAKNFGGSDVDLFQSVTAVPGGVVAAGDSGSIGNGDLSGLTKKGGNDAIIVKYDDNGDVLWAKNFGGAGGDYYHSVIAVSGGFIAAGYSGNGSFGNGDWSGVTGKGGNDAIIVKYDDNGDVLWAKNFGGAGGDYYYSVTAAPGGFVAAGYSEEDSFGNGDWSGVNGKGGNDAIIVKYDNNGDVLWAKNFGGADGDYFRSVTAAPGGFTAAGYSEEGSFGNGDWSGVNGKGDSDAIAVKYDGDGNITGKRSFGGSGSDAYQSVTAVSGGFVTAGESASGSFGNGDWSGVNGKGSNDAFVTKQKDIVSSPAGEPSPAV